MKLKCLCEQVVLSAIFTVCALIILVVSFELVDVIFDSPSHHGDMFESIIDIIGLISP